MLTFVSIKYVCTAPTNTAFGQLADDIPGVTDLLTNDIDLLQKVLGQVSRSGLNLGYLYVISF